MVGVESGSQEMLDRLKKDMKIEQVLETADLCARHGVGAIFNFIVGFPGESEQSVQATLALAKHLRRSNPAFETPIFYYRPYPGNPMADESAAQGYAFPRGLSEWADFDYVGGRGPWITPDRWQRVERFKFYTQATPGSRVRGAGRCAPPPSGDAITTGTACRSRRCSSSWCVRRSRCRDGSAARTRATFSPRMPKSSG